MNKTLGSSGSKKDKESVNSILINQGKKEDRKVTLPKETMRDGENPREKSDEEEEEEEDGPLGSLSDPNSTTVLALGAASGAVALMFILMAVMYATGRKRLPPAPPGQLQDPTLRMRGAGGDLPPHYAADFIRKKAVAAAAAGRKAGGGGGGGYRYRFNGGMGLAGTGSTLMRDGGLPEEGQQHQRPLGTGGGGYATLASFTNVPIAASYGARGQTLESRNGTYR